MDDMPISYFSPEECNTVASQVLPSIESKMNGDPFLTGLYPVMKKNLEALSISMALADTSDFTSKIDKADDEFDAAFISFRNLTDATAGLQKVTEKVTSAQVIKKIVDKYGRTFYNGGDIEQIGIMNAFSQELATPQMQSTLETAGVKEEYDLVMERHVTLSDLYRIRNEAGKETANILPPGQQKKVVAKDLSDVYNYFSSIKRFCPDYVDVASYVENVFSKVATIARSRKTRSMGNGSDVVKDDQSTDAVANTAQLVVSSK